RVLFRSLISPLRSPDAAELAFIPGAVCPGGDGFRSLFLQPESLRTWCRWGLLTATQLVRVALVVYVVVAPQAGTDRMLTCPAFWGRRQPRVGRGYPGPRLPGRC